MLGELFSDTATQSPLPNWTSFVVVSLTSLSGVSSRHCPRKGHAIGDTRHAVKLRTVEYLLNNGLKRE